MQSFNYEDSWFESDRIPFDPRDQDRDQRNTYRRMRDNMDINAGVIADGEQSIQEVGREIFDMVMKVASGERTCAERLGHKEFVLRRIGPVL